MQQLSGRAFDLVRPFIDDAAWPDSEENGDREQLLELLAKPELLRRRRIRTLVFFDVQTASDLRKDDDD